MWKNDVMMSIRSEQGEIIVKLKDCYELQMIDCNCNNCAFMQRDTERLNAHRKTYEGTGLMDNLNFGMCKLFCKQVSFIPQTCQLETQHCFVHRNGPKKPDDESNNPCS